jgi:hypothetical protein
MSEKFCSSCPAMGTIPLYKPVLIIYNILLFYKIEIK